MLEFANFALLMGILLPGRNFPDFVMMSSLLDPDPINF